MSRQSPPIIETLHLFPVLDKMLIELLSSLSADEWQAQTVARLWKVKDVAAHLLDGNIRTISLGRDAYIGDPPDNIRSYEDLLKYLNDLNADWVKAMKRTSPSVLTEFLQLTGKQYYEQLSSWNLFDKAMFPVSWAGEELSLNWFHIAREYTEKWLHQQQIRDAVNKPALLTKEFYHPFLETAMRALPYTYRDVPAPEGTIVQVTITGEGGGDWFIIMKDQWQLTARLSADAAGTAIIEGEVAWKLFSKSLRKKDLEKYIQLKGDRALAGPALEMISFMA